MFTSLSSTMKCSTCAHINNTAVTVTSEVRVRIGAHFRKFIYACSEVRVRVFFRDFAHGINAALSYVSKLCARG